MACDRDAMAESAEEMTPLKQKLDEFGTFLSKVPSLDCFRCCKIAHHVKHKIGRSLTCRKYVLPIMNR